METGAWYWPSELESHPVCCTLSSSAVKTCADDDVDLDDISCKYWVVTIRINLPK